MQVKFAFVLKAYLKGGCLALCPAILHVFFVNLLGAYFSMCGYICICIRYTTYYMSLWLFFVPIVSAFVYV